MIRYVLKFGSYYLENENGEVLLMTDRVAVAYDNESFTLLKHGALDQVMVYMKGLEARSPELSSSIVVATFPRNYPVENLNRLLDTSGYMRFLIQGLEEEP